MANRKQIDIYVSVHKGIRHLVGRLSFMAGFTNWEDPEAVSLLAEEWKIARKLLQSHHEHEDRFIHPLLAKISHGSHHSYESDHQAQQNALSHIDGHIRRVVDGNGADSDKSAMGLEFYRELNLFYSDFLRHLHREEIEAERILNALSLPEELESLMARLIGSIPRDEMLLYIDSMFPAMNLRECAEFLNNFKSGAAEDAFRSLWEHVRRVRGETDWGKIRTLLK